MLKTWNLHYCVLETWILNSDSRYFQTKNFSALEKKWRRSAMDIRRTQEYYPSKDT